MGLISSAANAAESLGSDFFEEAPGPSDDYDHDYKHANTIFVVGDPAQTMFGFGGAKPTILSHELPHIFGEKLDTVKLLINYRSTGKIIDNGQNLARYNYSDLDGPFPQDIFLDVVPAPQAENGLEISWTEYGDELSEAEGVCSEIAVNVQDKNFDYGQVFVGARTRAQLAFMEAQLLEFEIPFISLSGGSFWLQKHVNKVIQYLTVAWAEDILSNPINLSKAEIGELEVLSSSAFAGIYNTASKFNKAAWGPKKGNYSHHRYLGLAFLDACKDEATGLPSYRHAQRAANTRFSFTDGVRDLTSFVNDIVAMIYGLNESLESAEFSTKSLSVGDVAKMIIDNCITPWLEAEDGFFDAEGGKAEDLQSVIKIAKDFTNVGNFLDYVNKMVEASQANDKKDWDDVVVISTIHKLKGLERDIVFSIGWAEDILPHAFSKKAPPSTGVLPPPSQSEIWEERCIAYVAITRPAKKLYLSYPQQYNGNNMSISRFVYEMGVLEPPKEDKNE